MNSRPSNLPFGSWLADLQENGKLSEAEKHFVKCCARGETWEPQKWSGKRPRRKTVRNTIRAELISFFARGGDAQHPIHGKGILMKGAFVTGILDLRGVAGGGSIRLEECRLDQPMNLMGTHLSELVLTGSSVPKLEGDGLRLDGDLFCDDGFECQEGVRLISARIDGDVYLDSGTFRSNERAIFADSLIVTGTLYLAQAKVEGAISLISAKVGTLKDDKSCWRSGGHLLDGLRYDRIIGPVDSGWRIAWLRLQRTDQLTDEDFAPQPFEQLTRTLQDMGHRNEAIEVAIAKQKALHAAQRTGGILQKTFHIIYGRLAGFGYRPMWLIGWMIVVWLVCAIYYYFGAQAGVIGPTDPALTSVDLAPQIADTCGHSGEGGKRYWTQCPAMPPEYSSFHSLVYSLDVILPLVDLQQEVDWAPIAENAAGRTLPFGEFLRWLVWIEILFGWGASLMLVAILSRLVEKD